MPENERPRPDRPLARRRRHAAGAKPAGPAVIEVTRGAMVESRHLATIAVVDAKGKVVMAAGDIEAPIFPRSAVKPIQALALIETGAADIVQPSVVKLGGISDAWSTIAFARSQGIRCV
ncbi:MAG: asparaginase, partial [Proteobacteria bacterium]|nr:asparaginase [Pseudomonadota bacterium]